jgi:hypothetical protein
MNRIWVAIALFKRGHASWMGFAVAFINASLIWYRLLIEKVSWLHEIIPKFSVFIMFFFPAYVMCAILIGYWDFKRGTYPIESGMFFRRNPFAWEQFRRLKNIETTLLELYTKVENIEKEVK